MSLKIAYVSVYNTQCGIATYNKNLVSELQKITDVHVFAEREENTTSNSLVTHCWDRNEHPKFDLIDSLDEYQPDVIHFSHEYGFFPKAYQFTTLLSYLKSRNYKIITTFHSVYDHLDKTVQEMASPNIIVHTEEAKNCLIQKGIKNNIRMIPHGTNFLSDNEQILPKLWNTWGNEHTIFHPGFLFHYKGHLKMLDVIYELKKKYPDVQYIIQGSENPRCMNEHDQVYDEIIDKATKLNLTHNITINRGFVGLEALLSCIRTVKCCVLPYVQHPQHEVRATSGIARIILGTEIPLITSNVHLFDDIKHLVLYSKSDSEIYQNINSVFENSTDFERVKKEREHFLKETSWANTAQRILELYRKI